MLFSRLNLPVFHFHKRMFFISIIITIIIVLNLVTYGTTVTKIWKYDWDIYDSKNWIDDEHCDGLSFDSSSYYPDVVIDNLEVKKIDLPARGSLHLIDGAVIKFDENSNDRMNCARVKITTKDRHWMLPDNWIIQGVENNEAIPHKERVPCEYDDVIFPKGWKSGLCSLDPYYEYIKIKTLQFGNDTLTSLDLMSVYNSPVEIFDYIPNIEIKNQPCTDITGCRCGNENCNKAVCAYTNFNTDLRCFDAIKPTGFCTEMCGASIVFEPRTGFRIDDVRRALKHYSSDTYVSKVRNVPNDTIQIVFAEKEFTGSSLDEARSFYAELMSDKSYGARRVQLFASSSYVPQGSFAGTTLSILFGTMCAVVVFFAILFLVYSHQEQVVQLRDRLHFTSRPLSSFRSNLFAKFENTENEVLVIGECQSLGGSILSLDKTFDNPMYGKSSPSTASTSYDTIPSAEIKVTTAEISVENPMYDFNNLDNNVEDITEEGELIDLKKKGD